MHAIGRENLVRRSGLPEIVYGALRIPGHELHVVHGICQIWQTTNPLGEYISQLI
jgi:hypothetical protein